jgi:subfamily B ATP-binding cassette protein MsbA
MWEGVTSLKLIRSFAREGYEIDRFRAVSERIRRRILHLDLLWAAPAPMSEVLGAMLMGALILAGVAVGLGVAPLVAFLAVLYRSLGPTREFLQDKVALEGMVGAIEDVSDYLAATREPYLLSGPRPAPDFAGEVEFRAVSFRYAPTEPLALDRVSFSVRKGQTTAIVGRSGAGKTTLMELFFRFRDPTSGEILADGERLTDLDLAGWRSRLSLMSQDAQLFNETVAANIGYGDLAADDRAIRRAAEVAGAAEFIEALPDGYQTHLGDRGMRLSGGQRQRIALARTILKNPQILLLDEPTNALDGESERRFQTALEAYARGRTVVVIAHRLSTVRGAHQVIVLEAGRVVERGRPEELLSRPGHFARLYGLQADPRREAV